ncbi:hypothetical protein ACFWVC_21780 [Streptomyces sp. NPDC058691]|uniref:hypothetical protein n=1 Tax=Streptomyces sp. NPDC058691 TaxID=3346601 RepID=UPI0036597A2E
MGTVVAMRLDRVRQQTHQVNTGDSRGWPSTHAWQLVMPEKDEAGAAEKVVSQLTGADGGDGQGQRLAVVYDGGTDTVKLYADGCTNAQATADLPDG